MIAITNAPTDSHSASNKPLTDLAHLRSWLGNSDLNTSTEHTRLLSGFIDTASRRICTWLGQDPQLQSYQERQDGRGNRSLYLPYTPVTQVDGVYVDGMRIPELKYGNVPGAGYYLQRQLIRLSGFSFTPGVGNVLIEYQAGYAVIPELIRHACARLAAIEYWRHDWRGSATRQLGREWVQLPPDERGEEILHTLHAYRRVG